MRKSKSRLTGTYLVDRVQQCCKQDSYTQLQKIGLGGARSIVGNYFINDAALR